MPGVACRLNVCRAPHAVGTQKSARGTHPTGDKSVFWSVLNKLARVGGTGGPISVYPHSMRAPGIALSGASIEGFTKHF